MTRRQRLTLVAAITGSFVVALDATLVNVALPSIGRDLGGGLAGQQWVVGGYLVALASLMLLGGSLADLYGPRRTFAAGIVGFGATSLVAAAAPSIEMLAAARVAQGAAGALVAPSALALIAGAFEPERRGAAVGSWAAWSGIAAIVGPLVGGALADLVSWRWLFALNLPFAVAALALVLVATPRSARGGEAPALDWPGAVLSLAGLGAMTLALMRQPLSGWGAADVLGPGLSGAALLALFVAREARAAHPMLPLCLFGMRNFAAVNVQTLAIYSSLGILFFYLALFLQQVAGASATEAGLVTLPSTVALFALSKRAGALADRHGARRFLAAGPLVAAAGLVLLVRLDADARVVADVLPPLGLFALGLGATVAPLTATALAGAGSERAGIASGVNTAFARAAGLVGIAAVGVLVATQFSGGVDARLDVAALSPAAREAVVQAEARTLARADVAALGSREASLVADATEAAAVDAVRSGIAVSAALMALAGLIGLVFVRDREATARRRVRPGPCRERARPGRA